MSEASCNNSCFEFLNFSILIKLRLINSFNSDNFFVFKTINQFPSFVFLDHMHLFLHDFYLVFSFCCFYKTLRSNNQNNTSRINTTQPLFLLEIELESPKSNELEEIKDEWGKFCSSVYYKFLYLFFVPSSHSNPNMHLHEKSHF